MKQWFSGKFAGHYRGSPTQASGFSHLHEAEHFSIEVYEAMVSDIELGPLVTPPLPSPKDEDGIPKTEPAPEIEIKAHHVPERNALHQHHISKVHLVDPLRIGETLRSTAHDVLMSEITLSHGARSSSGAMGRIEGTISGWFTPPPEPQEVQEVPASDHPPPVGWRTESVPTPKTDSFGRPTHTNQADPLRIDLGPTSERVDHGDAAFSEETNSEALEDEVPIEAGGEYPFFSLGLGLTALLTFFATPFSAGLFAVPFLLSYGLRRWLHGVVPDVSGVRAFALFVGGGQVLLATLLVARWASLGCVSLSPLPLFFLLSGQMFSSLLPRPLPYALTSVSYVAVLFQAYGEWAAPLCVASQ